MKEQESLHFVAGVKNQNFNFFLLSLLLDILKVDVIAPPEDIAQAPQAQNSTSAVRETHQHIL